MKCGLGVSWNECVNQPEFSRQASRAAHRLLGRSKQRRPSILQGFLQEIEAQLVAQGRGLFCWLPVLLGLGSACYFSLKAEPPLLALMVLGFILVLGMGSAWRASPTGNFPCCQRSLGLGAAAFSAGVLLAFWQAHRQPMMPDLPHEAVWLEGQITETMLLPPRQDRGSPRLRLSLGKVVFDSPWYRNTSPLQREIRVVMTHTDGVQEESGRGALSQELGAGQHVRLRAVLHSPAPPFLPGGYDPQREAWFSGLAGNGTVYGRVQLQPTGTETFLMKLDHLRAHLAAEILHDVPGENGAIAATILTGETGAVSFQLRQDFAASGLAHILAVAGLHLGMVMMFFAFAVRWVLVSVPYLALRLPCRSIALGCALVGGAGYVALTGAHLPGVRALGMASLATFGLLLGRKALSMRSLALVALGLLVARPVVVLDVSFQMSFSAVMALIAGYERCGKFLWALRQESGFWRLVGVPVLVLALTSLLAGSATIPASLAHFGRFQPWFVLANLIAVPLMGMWIMPLGVMTLLLMPFHLEKLALVPMSWGLTCVRILAKAVANFPAASLPVGLLPAWSLAIVLSGLCVLCLWKGRGRLLGLPLMGCAVAAGLLMPRPDVLLAPDGRFVAVREGGSYRAGPGKNTMLRDVWAEDTGLNTSALFPEECAHGFCRLNGVALLASSGGGFHAPEPQLCEGVRLVVMVQPERSPCPAVPVLSRLSARRDGAWAVYARGQEVRLVSDRSWRGERPWVPAPGFEGVPGLPLAQAE